MIIIDTNVLSELIRPNPSEAVLNWMNREPRSDQFITTITASELLAGVALLPMGKRRLDIEVATSELLDRTYRHQILDFDIGAARAYGAIVARTRQLGFTIARADAEIAAIAQAQDFAVATRDVKPFIAAGVRVVNPWVDD